MSDLDVCELEVACPECAFLSVVTYRDLRLGTPTICRGCKNTLVPDDAMGGLAQARHAILETFRELKETLNQLSN